MFSRGETFFQVLKWISLKFFYSINSTKSLDIEGVGELCGSSFPLLLVLNNTYHINSEPISSLDVGKSQHGQRYMKFKWLKIMKYKIFLFLIFLLLLSKEIKYFYLTNNAILHVNAFFSEFIQLIKISYNEDYNSYWEQQL